MISEEGSCDTGDWCNDAKNAALITEINYILKYIQIESSFLNSKNISQYDLFCCILDQINAGLVSRRKEKKHKKSYCSKAFDW